MLAKQEIDQCPRANNQVGIDLGLKAFAITSDNKKYRNT